MLTFHNRQEGGCHIYHTGTMLQQPHLPKTTVPYLPQTRGQLPYLPDRNNTAVATFTKQEWQCLTYHKWDDSCHIYQTETTQQLPHLPNYRAATSTFIYSNRTALAFNNRAAATFTYQKLLGSHQNSSWRAVCWGRHSSAPPSGAWIEAAPLWGSSAGSRWNGHAHGPHPGDQDATTVELYSQGTWTHKTLLT